MGAIGGDEMAKWEKDQGIVNDEEEKILVLVRLRPLSEKEISGNEVSDWECINETTILYRNSLQERSGLPTAYSFDRVFRADCPTKRVYEEGTKAIALSVVTGVNSTIFAYGQTSSGKTYTMNGITEYTVADIYDYIGKHEERAFVLKFAAMEIYNEVARDLLSTDNTPLRLLDDPDKGTIIERLTEETVSDWGHLKKLLSICEAQRHIGETGLNEKSSRSHQILRLTIESSAREFIGKDNSTTLTASVNFVDLAGSERASQALSAGQRLKEGCHINRSLLTLGTVIRKLSKGRHGHVNYRDSKLTRILQPSLGGNARTAIICTVSPARSHVEQSRNTLLFASCAKEVTTNAQVNVVMSDKALVKHLQREVARLESELKTPGTTSDYAALLRKKDLQIEKLEKEVRELRKQRDHAHTRLESLLRRDVQGNITAEDEYSVSELSDETSGRQLSENSLNHSPSDLTSTPTSNGSKFDITRVSRGKEDNALGHGEDSDEICKVVRCIEVDDSSGHRTPELDESIVNGEGISTPSVSNSEDITYQDKPRQARELENGFRNRVLDKKGPDVQFTTESSPDTSGSKSLKWARSGSCRPDVAAESSPPGFDTVGQFEATPPYGLEKSFSGRPQSVQRKHWKAPLFTSDTNCQKLFRSNSQSSINSALMDDLKLEENVLGDEDIPSVDSFVAGLKEMAKRQFGNQINGQVQGRELVLLTDVGSDPVPDSTHWQLQFLSLQRSIVELWGTCNVSLVHRTYFFLLFRGDPMDSIYMEVELRRLSFLKETFSIGNLALQDDQASTVTSSLKALLREKQMLMRLMDKRLNKKERERIYEKWGISLKSKQRKMQLVEQLWSNSEDMKHVAESAEVVAKVVRFTPEGNAIKEMFGLSFTPPSIQHRRSFSWKNSKRSLV